MTGIETLKGSITTCMFDQYGTVVDMQGGLRDVAADFLKAKGWAGDPNAFVTWWRRTHFENSMIDALLQREHMPYREIGPYRGRGSFPRRRHRTPAMLPRGPRSPRPPARAIQVGGVVKRRPRHAGGG
jgi:hypothetical protein